MNKIEYWIKEKDINGLYTSEYWNNIEEEEKKVWWIESEKDLKVKKYLKNSGLEEEFELAVNSCNIKGNVLDLAAGTCWTSALLSKKKEVEKVDSVEFSHHRIDKLAPNTIASLDGDSSKINRILGSFYDIKRSDDYYDTIILSQAYHHAQYPLKLFHECDRVLKKGGSIVIIGEHIIGFKRVFRRFIKKLLSGKLFTNIHEEFYNHSDPLGDHSYLIGDYKFTFYAYDYDYKVISSNIRNSTIFIGKKR